LAFLNVSVFGHQAALLITVSFNKIPVFGDVSQVADSSLFSHFDPLVQTQLLKKKNFGLFQANKSFYHAFEKQKPPLHFGRQKRVEKIELQQFHIAH